MRRRARDRRIGRNTPESPHEVATEVATETCPLAIPACHPVCAGAEVGQAVGERERGEERLAAAERLHRLHHVRVPAIDYLEVRAVVVEPIATVAPSSLGRSSRWRTVLALLR